ncbi:uncharacterized protein BDFB_005149 [Asbolus verrucosus]|uniref:MADF domain-containing protein n=1 Tax=Asbolus verrucosus TaxID=1661398 RepID=A0A482VBG6_ASBVE|nr:uncharacterized protein BDFB_005149 [Asbolus verrucosus]
MTDLRQYTKKFLVEFIDLYKSHPTLWQIKNKEYRDKAKKAAAYELLVNKCREVEPDCDKDTVVKKINSLRTCYRKELKKVQRSLRAGTGEVYKPKLWYYDLLSFLNEDTFLSGDSFFYLDEDVTSDFFGVQSDPLTSQSESLSESARSSPTSMFVPSEAPKNKRARREGAGEAFIGQRGEEDEFDLLGKIYANKLRHLEKNQRIYAEKIINDTLFEAQLGNLSRRCRLVADGPGREREFHQQTSTEIDLKPEYPDSDPADTSYIDP